MGDAEPKASIFKKRYFVTFMLFLGMANAYVMRTNMSVAIVAMVNYTAINAAATATVESECPDNIYVEAQHDDGEFVWDTKLQSYVLSSFFYGYVLTQVPFGYLIKYYGALHFLGWGMLINSVFGFLVPIAAYHGDIVVLCIIRFIQGLGEGPIVPCTHALLAKWIPPDERSRMGSFVYAGAQFGTIISMPLSGLLAQWKSVGGWPSIFYFFGTIGVIWSIAFLIWVAEDPAHDTKMKESERTSIQTSIGSSTDAKNTKVPFKGILTSAPFYAILIAHMGHNYGYETLMTELPTYMKQVLRVSLAKNGFLSALPYLAMWIFSICAGIVADWLIITKKLTRSQTRKVFNSIGQYGAGLALVAASYTGCSQLLTIIILTIGVGLNGAIYSGFKINHLDLSPKFAGFLMSLTNCMANLVGLLGAPVAGYLVHENPTIAQWRKVFFIAAFVYFAVGTVYNIFGSSEKQKWDQSDEEAAPK